VKPAGYSGTPLARKLGIPDGGSFTTIGAPPNYDALVAPLSADTKRTTRLGKTPGFVHLFCTKRSELVARLTSLRRSLEQTGTVWVSWPKKSSKISTDITEDVIRDVALPLGFVDVKVCAVDDTWSGLKLVIRKTERLRP
jgi:hypothetical protein